MLQEVNVTLFAISFGALLGAIGNKLIMEYQKSNWKFGYYILSGISILLPIMEIVFNYKSLNTFNFRFYIFVFLVFIIGIFLLIFTIRFLDNKSIFSTLELDIPINEFTKSADKTEIKLFGGDLSFLGNSPTEIDGNKQYLVLKQQNFFRISILCEVPQDTITMIRYGKILHELRAVQLRFYNPDEADLRIRGRMIKIDGADKLLIYKKIKSNCYETIKTDTGNSNGALYSNIWNLIWSLAKPISSKESTEFIELFRS